MSRKFRPARSSISTIQTSGSNFTSRRKIGLHFRVGRRQRGEARRERPGSTLCSLEGALRRRTEQIGRAVEPADANEYGARFLGAASAHDTEYAFDLTAAQVGGDPKRSLETHLPSFRSRGASADCINANGETCDEVPWLLDASP